MYELTVTELIVYGFSIYLAYQTYEYLEYTSFVQFIKRFIDWFIDYESQIWIDGLIILLIGITLYLLAAAILVWFWLFILWLPFEIYSHLMS